MYPLHLDLLELLEASELRVGALWDFGGLGFSRLGTLGFYRVGLGEFVP